MKPDENAPGHIKWPTLSGFPVSVKALVTATILVMNLAMAGALGQILVHDLIPAFFEKKGYHESPNAKGESAGEPGPSLDREIAAGRGDLFSQPVVENEKPAHTAFYKSEQFVWLLKWSHIHLFGMNMIFIFVGAITVFLNLTDTHRTWLVVLPFAGVLIDIGAMWLKAYVSPVFFWLHLPGGGLFGVVFVYVSIRALLEMWFWEARSPGQGIN